ADDQGRDRVLLKTPNWEDFVHLACSEIRACGASNVQIARRMRAMLDNLLATLPSHRHPALTQELGRLDRALESLYPIPDELWRPPASPIQRGWARPRRARGRFPDHPARPG